MEYLFNQNVFNMDTQYTNMHLEVFINRKIISDKAIPPFACLPRVYTNYSMKFTSVCIDFN